MAVYSENKAYIPGFLQKSRALAMKFPTGLAYRSLEISCVLLYAFVP